jgi:hypothetical protein
VSGSGENGGSLLLKLRAAPRQITSLALHWFPTVVTWSTRWYPHHGPDARYGAKSAQEREEWESGNLSSLVVVPMALYFMWAVAYFIKVAHATPSPRRMANAHGLAVAPLAKSSRSGADCKGDAW